MVNILAAYELFSVVTRE